MLRLIFLTTLLAAANLLNAQSKIRLIGFDFDYENVRYDNILNTRETNDDFKKSQVEVVAPNGFEFYNDIGKPDYRVVIMYVNDGQYYPHLIHEKSEGKKFNLSAEFQIKSKESYNPHHVFSIGISHQKRTLFAGEFGSTLGDVTIDTIPNPGQNFHPGDSTIVSYRSLYQSARTSVTVSQLLLKVGYQYKLFPNNKTGVSLGGGIEAGLSYKGYFGGLNTFYEQINYKASSPYIYMGSLYNVISYSGAKNNFAGGLTVRPYASLAISYRLSKSAPFFNNVTLFAQGRFGWDGTIIKRGATMAGNLFASTSFGISYIFDKYYKA